MKFLLSLLFILVLFSGAVGVSWFLITQEEDVPQTTPITFQSASKEDQQKFNLVVVQDGENQRRVLSCQKSYNCQPESIPSGLEVDPVFDGQSWYHYTENEDSLILQRSWLKSEENETIVSETSLVKPRGLYISPDGNQLAYWLDNTTDTSLTELWSYDNRRGSTTIVAEKLNRNDIITTPYWNRASTHLWFFNKDHQVQIIPTGNVQPYLPPRSLEANIDPEDFLPTQLDVNPTGQAIAYTTVSTSDKSPVSTLTILPADGSDADNIMLTGTIPYIEWLSNDRLIFAVQDSIGTSFWQFQNNNHSFLARYDHLILTARSDVNQQYLVFTTPESNNKIALHSLDFTTGEIKSAGQISQNDTSSHIVRAEVAEDPNQPQVAGITTELSDEELVAFTTKNLTTIVNIPDAKATKIYTTDQANTLYVDYKTSEIDGRILLTVRDATHVEWSVRAWYRTVGQEWRKVEGGGVKNPEVARLYEWEEDVNQWILKSENISPPA